MDQRMIKVGNGILRSLSASSKLNPFSLVKTQTRHKTDVFPIPKSFLANEAARKRLKHDERQIVRQKSLKHDDTNKTTFPDAKAPPELEQSSHDEPASHSLVPQKALLSNSIEAFINNHVADYCGLSTDKFIEQHRSISPSDIYPFLPAYITRGTLESSSVKLLWSMLESVLPPDPLNSEVVTPRGKFAHRQWSDASPEIDATVPSNRMNLGWHLAMFPYPVKPNKLLHDGTDTRFIPGPPDAWPYRLWAGGSIRLHTPHAPMLDNKRGTRIHHMIERPQNLRIAGRGSSQRAFLTIRKLFYLLEGVLELRHYNENDVMSWLTKEGSNKSYFGPFLEEEYTLCFLRDRPKFDIVSTKPVKPLTQPKFSHTLTPNRHLLFSWSSITCNAHLIHLDPNFTREVYGAPNLLVHGPLTVFLLLEWFHRALTAYTIDRLDKFHLVSIDYQNIAPLFVDEPMTLCAKPTEFQKPGTLAPSWDVWIEKEVGKGLKSMAFKGQIKLASEPFVEPTTETNTGNTHRKEYAPIHKAGSEFKSPFFGDNSNSI